MRKKNARRAAHKFLFYNRYYIYISKYLKIVTHHMYSCIQIMLGIS